MDPRESVPLPISDRAGELVGRACAAASRKWTDGEVRALSEIKLISEAPGLVRRECVLALAWSFLNTEWVPREHPWSNQWVLAVVARKPAPLTATDLEELIAGAEAMRRDHPGSVTPSMMMERLTPQFRSLYKLSGRAERDRVAALIERAARLSHYAKDSRRLTDIITRAEGADPWAAIDDADDVGPQLRAALQYSTEPTETLSELMRVLTAYPASGRPSKKWTAEAAQVSSRLADPSRTAGAILSALLAAKDTQVDRTWRGEVYTRVWFVQDRNEGLACAAIAFIATLRSDEYCAELRRLAVKALGRPARWERSLRIANACVRALREAGSETAARELVALQRSTTHGGVLLDVAAAIDAIAAESGRTSIELLEATVETHGLDEDRSTSRPVVGGLAVLRVEDLTARVVFVGADGRERASFPTATREQSTEPIDGLREQAKVVRKTIAAERARLDGLMSANVTWSTRDWQRLYMDHPITGHLTLRLIWRFVRNGEEVIGLPLDRKSVSDVTGAVSSVAKATVSLWHPLHSTTEQVHAWKMRLLSELIVQPFRQAFREVYVLKPDEERRNLSNRFAGHVFRQTQARALMKRRGWRPVPAAWWDDGIEHGVARRLYDDAGIRAEFFFDPIEDIEPDPSGVYRYCTSDQVRFFRGSTDDPVDLAEVPPVVFSEAMRDVDLFVSVTSIGADQDWLDRKEGRRFEKYWHETCFGPLAAAGEIRRDLLAELLPRLPIGESCELDDAYLVVHGKLRTYRIHLGSGLVRMSPTGAQLRLKSVPNQTAARLLLPIDDDPILVRILASALTLARDDDIQGDLAKRIRAS